MYKRNWNIASSKSKYAIPFKSTELESEYIEYQLSRSRIGSKPIPMKLRNSEKEFLYWLMKKYGRRNENPFKYWIVSAQVLILKDYGFPRDKMSELMNLPNNNIDNILRRFKEGRINGIIFGNDLKRLLFENKYDEVFNGLYKAIHE